MKIVTIALAALLPALSSGCTINHYIAKDYPQYLSNNQSGYSYGTTDAAHAYDLAPSTKNFKYEFRAVTTGYANLWIVEIGSMLEATMESADVQKAFGGIARVSNLASRDQTVLILELEKYEFIEFAAKLKMRARLQRDGNVLFEKEYQNSGRSQGGKMLWGGAFAQRNAVHQSTKSAIDEILGQLIRDLNSTSLNSGMSTGASTKAACLNSALKIEDVGLRRAAIVGCEPNLD